ncbi:IPT/TIG domain-containing protein [Cryptosporangium arvum]|uniref:IPT/TIG domain-containing protein n=1 Tax=Cryptosporangium arvum TaxID=80871 RepID=UPI0004B892F9|nr:IPT/TIG domain-containing protein [Cryptosporangium arvum]
MLHPRSRRTRLAAALGATVLAGGGVVAVAGVAQAATAPAISIKSLSTSKGSIAGGTAVLITGKGFSALSEADLNSVKFGSVAVSSFTVINDTQIATKAPAPNSTSTDDTVKVRVTITDGTDTSANTTADDFTYIAPITAVAPANTVLSAAGGTTVRLTLTGTGLDLGTASTFGAKKITATVNGVAGKLKYVDADEVDLTAPAGTPTITSGKVTIAVLNDGVAGTVDDTNAKYVAVVTKLSVASGKTTGTTGTDAKAALTITGAGLTGATWKIGSTDLTCVAATGKAATTWTCKDVPAGSAGPVSITPSFSSGATAGVTAGATYTYADL